MRGRPADRGRAQDELLDALPVHRVVQRGSVLKEIYVGLEGDSASRLIELEGGLSTPAISDYFRTEGITLQNDQFAEAGLAAASWIESAGASLQPGFVITIDYGREARELYDHLHMRGTALAYFHHQASENFYAAPGEQDLTCHVCWDWLAGALSAQGFATPAIESQEAFFIHHAANYIATTTTAEAARFSQRKLALLQLLHPSHLGQKFQVLHARRDR